MYVYVVLVPPILFLGPGTRVPVLVMVMVMVHVMYDVRNKLESNFSPSTSTSVPGYQGLVRSTCTQATDLTCARPGEVQCSSAWVCLGVTCESVPPHTPFYH